MSHHKAKIAIILALAISSAARDGIVSAESAAPANLAIGDERAYVLEMLAVFAYAANRESRELVKGSAAIDFRIKAAELDRLAFRIRRGDHVRYKEIDDAIDPLVRRLVGCF